MRLAHSDHRYRVLHTTLHPPCLRNQYSVTSTALTGPWPLNAIWHPVAALKSLVSRRRFSWALVRSSSVLARRGLAAQMHRIAGDDGGWEREPPVSIGFPRASHHVSHRYPRCARFPPFPSVLDDGRKCEPWVSVAGCCQRLTTLVAHSSSLYYPASSHAFWQRALRLRLSSSQRVSGAEVQPLSWRHQLTVRPLASFSYSETLRISVEAEGLYIHLQASRIHTPF